MNHRLIELVKQLNFQQSSESWYNFKINQTNSETSDRSTIFAGKILPENAKILTTEFPKQFSCIGDDIFFNQQNDNSSFDEKSLKLAQITKALAKAYPSKFPGWRDEQYCFPYDNPVAKIERACINFFGVNGCGSHLTIFRNQPDLEILIAKRSALKSNYPSMYDNAVAGGLPYGLSPRECIEKEAGEEAGIFDKKLLESILYIGSTWYTKADPYYGFRKQFCYQLDVTDYSEFEPNAIDGEVDSFEWCNLDRVCELLCGQNFKASSAFVTFHFLLRNKFLNSSDFDDEFLSKNMDFQDN